jgi:hypothetical protein
MLKVLIVTLIIIIEYGMFVYIRKINDDLNKK